jgi:acetyl esterase/lipase
VRNKRPQVIRAEESYGSDALQAGEWFIPEGDGPAPTVMLVHGGFWSPDFERSLQDAVADNLAGQGYLVWNIDYRSAGARWPATFLDVAAAYDHLQAGRYAHRVDPSRLALVGHSAGGQLVAWLAARRRLRPSAPGADSDSPPPTLFVAQAGVLALTHALDQRRSAGPVRALLGGTPEEFPNRYRDADPIDSLPTGVRSVLFHSRRDKLVPFEQSRTYVTRATEAGDDSTLVVTPGDHFTHIDPKSVACQRLRETLATMSG